MKKGPQGPFFIPGFRNVGVVSVKRLWLRFSKFVVLVARRFQQDRCERVAGALSFTTVLAVVPLTAVIIAVLSLFPVFDVWKTVIQDFIYSNFVPASGDVVQKYLTQFAGKAGRLTAVGLAFLMVTAIMLMATIEDAFNDIWRVTNTRKLLYRFLVYWALLTLGPILMAVSLTLTSRFFALPIFGQGESSWIHQMFDVAWPLVFETGAAVLLYMVVPNAPVRWRYALLGGVFAAVLIEVAKRLFAYSMKTFTSYQVVYGAVAALPIFLVWIYISWIVILLGAVVVATLNDCAARADNGNAGRA